MNRNNLRQVQTERDICRAEFLVALARGIGRDESVEALKYRAAAAGVSRHAAALAVLSTDPTDALLIVDRPSPDQELTPVEATPSFATEEAVAISSVVPLMRHGRHRSP